ncbi:hypothetical protein OKW34_000082 [Paraburkholderia youngii]|uniref:DUF4150 domain-containing protein n=1 Tax=Paraburkholderia youngii TaxID=2782701 RepID=UPI003D1A9979
MFAATKAGGQCTAALDVCKTPTPGGAPVPLPYPNIGMPPMASPTTVKVLIGGMPALTRSSQIPLTSGDEGGVAGGVVSSGVMGKMKFMSGSRSVRFEGSPAVRLNDQTQHNDGNAVGAVLTPSQTTVMVLN